MVTKRRIETVFVGGNVTDEETIGDIHITIQFQAENIQRLCMFC